MTTVRSQKPALAGTADTVNDDRVRMNVYLLAAAQALTGGNAAVIFATGSIVGQAIAPHTSLATVPISAYVVGLAMGTVSVGWISGRFGRRVAFLIGSGCGAPCGLLAAQALSYSSRRP